MPRLGDLRRVCAERSENQVAKLAANLGDRASGAVVQEQGPNRALNRKRCEPRIDAREDADADSFFNQRCEEIEAALARPLDDAVARLGQARFFHREELKKIAPLIKEL